MEDGDVETLVDLDGEFDGERDGEVDGELDGEVDGELDGEVDADGCWFGVQVFVGAQNLESQGTGTPECQSDS